MQYFSLQHWTFLSLPGASTAECPFGFGPTTSLAVELLVHVFHSSSVACWMPSDLRVPSSSAISLSLLFLFIGYSWQRYWSGLPVPTPGGLRLVRALHYDLSVLGVSARHSFSGLVKPLRHGKAAIHEGGITPYPPLNPKIQGDNTLRLPLHLWVPSVASPDSPGDSLQSPDLINKQYHSLNHSE